ncbi:MAG: tyrosine-type recombinase/integrase [Lachnospiraceae bacterium]|nr:tyrosine-type recombinase/integrase [Lachnospiraceae bacterium]
MEKTNKNEYDTTLQGDNTSLPLAELRLLLSCDMEAAKVKDMLTMAKRNYVMSHHPRKIFQLSPNKKLKNGCYKTYIYVDSKRKEVTAGTEEKLIEKLYVYYLEQDNKANSLERIFEKYIDYKKSCLNRSDKTISADKCMFKHVSKKLKNKNIKTITDEDIQRFIVSDLLPTKPKPVSLKRLLQLLRAVFDYAIRKKICIDNPLRYILAQDYYKYCDLNVKTDEEKAFSSEELTRLSEDAEKNLGNPRVLMALLAKETGMRVGELCALHTEDISSDFIHVHRQQVIAEGKNSKTMEEVPYTKDERLHPHNGRFIPITDEARRVINLAQKIPGKSPYLFHDIGSEKMIAKDGYIHNLKRRCKRLGCVPTNNHAFRMAFNSKLINYGFSASDRALILGHEVQTNETHYSLTDKRKLEDIKNRLKKEES